MSGHSAGISNGGKQPRKVFEHLGTTAPHSDTTGDTNVSTALHCVHHRGEISAHFCSGVRTHVLRAKLPRPPQGKRARAHRLPCVLLHVPDPVGLLGGGTCFRQ